MIRNLTGQSQLLLQDIGSMTFPKGNLFRNALPQQYPKPMTMASGISFPDLLWE